MSNLLSLFQALSSFEPTREQLKNAPWEAYVDWAISQGLGPLAAYNVEYRLAGGGAPQWARDRLLSVYQGSLNDNVMKLVNFKRAVSELEGRQVVLTGAASYAEVVYPHVAFRPVGELELWVSPEDVDGLTGFLGQSDFKSQGDEDGVRVLSDGRTFVLVQGKPLGNRRMALSDAMRARALPAKVYGSSLFRLELEDALLAHCHSQARAGHQVPYITFVDLRELLRGAPGLAGPYSRPLKVDEVRRRAEDAKLSRAVYASTEVVARLFPATAELCRSVQPPLRASTKALLDRFLVEPLSVLGREREPRGAKRLRQLLVD